jgi:Fic family protein
MDLKNHLKTHKIKIQDLAQALEVDASFISRVLSGQRKLQAKQIAKLAKYLSLPIADVRAYFLSIEVQKILAPYPKLVQEVFKLTEERIACLSGKKVSIGVQVPKALASKLNTLELLQQKWQGLKSLDQTQLMKLKEFIHTAYTYESNRIEGNTLSLQETHLVVNEGITVGGKTLQEHLEAISHQEAIRYIEELIHQNQIFSQTILLQIHRLVLVGIDPKNAGTYRKVQVRISDSKHLPPDALIVPELVEEYFDFYQKNKRKMHPVLLAAEMHERLVSIQPFVDGNGRTARLVMNLILLQHGYTIVNIKGNPKNRFKYYNALENVQLHHDATDFQELIADYALASLKAHLEMAG